MIRLAFLLLLLALPAHAKTERSQQVTRDFRKDHPCPATGKTTGACDGWQIDHITPLCRGGADAVQNLQWLTVEQHKLKTRGDCRALLGDR